MRITLGRLALGWLLLCCAVPLGARGDVPRPSGTGTGELLAKVHLVGGTGTRIKPGAGNAFAPRPTMPILRADTLVVPAGEFLIVHLIKNNHLVRVDDDVVLKVTDIVLLNAPRTAESLASQLDRMVSVDEKRTAERIAGTYATRSAGEAAPPEMGGLGLRGPGGGGGGAGAGTIGLGSVGTVGKGGGGGGSGQGYGSGGGSVGSRSAAAPKPARAQASAAPSPPPPASAVAPGGAPPAAQPAPAPVAAAPSPAPTPEPQAKRDAEKPTSRAADTKAANRAEVAEATPVVASPVAAPALKGCIASELQRLGLKLGKVTLRLRIEGGYIRRAALAGGLALPECARKLLVDQPYGQPHATPDQTWQSVDLLVK